MTQQDEVVLNQDTALVDVLDRLIDKGVVVEGDVMLSVADVELVYLGLRLVLCSVDRLSAPPQAAAAPAPAGAPPPAPASRSHPSAPADPSASAAAASTSGGDLPPERPAAPASPRNLDAVGGSAPSLLPNKPERDASSGLAQLVLTLVELLRELLERQAIRRLEHGTLTEAQVERMGDTFMRINAAMDDLKQYFDLDDDDLNLDLGPLGTLLER